jgi:uridine phosphorylase
MGRSLDNDRPVLPRMPYPNYPRKYREKALVTPAHILEYRRQRAASPPMPPPQGTILCYQHLLWDAVCADEGGTTLSLYGMRTLVATDHQVGIVGGFGIGAPAACFVLEGLIAYGVQRFVSVGTAGSLQEDLLIGDLVICDRAIRDEGTSHHYLAPSRYAHASPEMVARLTATLDERGMSYRVGSSWTLDAPYRETAAEVRHYGQEGVLTVDMEASALFAVAAYRGVELGAMFTISDTLTGDEWQHRGHGEEVRRGLQALYEAALSTLRAASKRPG